MAQRKPGITAQCQGNQRIRQFDSMSAGPHASKRFGKGTAESISSELALQGSPMLQRLMGSLQSAVG